MSPSATESKTNVTRFLLDTFMTAPGNSVVFDKLVKPASTHSEIHIENISNPSVKSLMVAGMFEQLKQPVLFVLSDPHDATRFYFELNKLLAKEDVYLYPTEDFTPYDLSVTPAQSLKAQYSILNKLKNGDPAVYIVSPKNLLLKHLSLKELENHALNLKVDQEISPEAVTEHCLAMGYLKTSLIKDPGEFSSRGDIFDLYPLQGKPVRIEFFGDTIETIRIIDVDNQRSIENTKSVTAIPRSGIVLHENNREKLTDLLHATLDVQAKDLDQVSFEGLKVTIDNQIAGMDQAFLPDGIDYYGPLIHKEYSTVLDYLPDNAVSVVDDWNVLVNNMAGLSDRLDTHLKEGIEKGRLLNLDFSYHISDTEAFAKLKGGTERQVYLDTLPLNSGGEVPEKAAIDVNEMIVDAPEQFKADLEKACTYLNKLRKDGVQIFINTDHPQRVLDACKEWEVPAVYLAEDSEIAEHTSADSKDVIITKDGLLQGFVLPKEKMAYLTDAAIYGRKQKRRLTDGKDRNKREEIDIINSVHDLREGDYVVHVKHGIGQFIELATIKIDGEIREYLSIQYASSDKLHVPVEQVNQLSRYRGAGDKPPKLSKMGGMEWSKVKGKVKQSIAVIAKDLQQLYAKRAKAVGFQHDADTPWQVEMEESFPYTETPDQWQAILDVKGDMEGDKPMDRLICGDVGFGKTEVALRAIFKCVLSGKQAAFLAPTTILTQQHYNTLTERFQAYPTKVGLLSRFRSPKEQKEVVNRLKEGECDIVVGTHRLLQKDVQFKDLGLVVVDEEQRFGVSHKEKLKHLRNEVDVLTLSATPIPRTLYMALSGIREMSLINTPPTNRAPIKTFVGPYNPAQIRMAILQEIDRGGQVFFLHNRVKTIYEKLAELQELIPEVKFTVGHGQMNERDLEAVMLDFAQGQFDVLLCTTIIESGLDIPSVNTIIIDRADRFGLAQLYQIRGRVGRSDIQAYAYLYYDPEKEITQDAKERLRAIREFTTLGSGYQIALRDLEIRGVGNVLGSEQHGHMIAVGFDLYCQMLEEEIQEIQEGKPTEVKEDSIIDLNVTALIPDKWVGNRDVKMMEYKRLADVDSELAIKIIRAEWNDRFGEIPPQTEQLLNLVRLRIKATELGFPLVRSDDDHIRISVPYSLQEWMYLQKKMPKDLGKKARWVPGVTSQQGSTPTLLVKHLGMEGSEQVDFLQEFFDGLSPLIKEAQEEFDKK